MISMREELQTTFSQSYALIVKLMQEKDERLFKYVQARISQSFSQTWYTVFTQLSTFVVPWLLCILIL